MAKQNYTHPYLPTITRACHVSISAVLAITYHFNINGYTSGTKGLHKKAVIINAFRGITFPFS
jgi:hypothetical protein